jgi:flagellar motility protein MotE (MotC chaperone)
VNRVRLLPVVILVIAALLVLKTAGLVTEGHYALTGVSPAIASGGGGETAGAAEAPVPTTLQQPTLSDGAPTMSDTAPTFGQQAAEGGEHGAEPTAHGEALGAEPVAPVEGEDRSKNSIADFNACAPRPVGQGGEGGQLTVVAGDCPPQTDALPQLATPGGKVDMAAGDPSLTDQVLLARLAARRSELETYEQELAMRASLIDAAEKRVNERTSTLAALETQISTLVEERKRLEQEQFTAIVSMYQTMKPKDAASIFDELDIEVLVRVAKMMPPRKMAPILAAMVTPRAQELTVRLAADTSENPERMGAADLAALPQIVGQ